MDGAAALWGLFAGSFLAATLLPGGSEAALVWLRLEDTHPAAVLLAVATAGNTLGGMSSWLLGRLAARAGRRVGRRDAAGAQPPDTALARVRRWGAPALLLSWLPFVGDALCVAAGWLGVRALPALAFIAAGKAARYAVLLAALP
ncbi:MAG TPA: DedA family protein [Chromatiales bacterium]|nr:DedA family protein [Chromatiales bacterium]